MRQTHIYFAITVLSRFRSNAQPEFLRQGLLFLSAKLLSTVESCQNEPSRRVKSASSSGASNMTSCRRSDDASSQLQVPFGSCRRVLMMCWCSVVHWVLLAVAAQALGIKQLEIGKVLFATSVLRASHLQQTQVPAPSCTVCMLSCRLDCHVICNDT